MPIVRCKLCGNLFNSERRKYCPNCIRRLDELYGRVHEYMRDNDDENFDMYTLADDMEISTADVQALVELGYIERDIQTYGKNKKSDRQKLAEEFNDELERMRQNKITTYGGVIYSRDKNEDNKQYAFDFQKSTRKK